MMQTISGNELHLTAAHAMQALHVMLDKELWQRLPLEDSAEAPSLKAAVEATSRDAAAAAPAQQEDFEAWMAHGNPWARQTSGSMHARGGVQTRGQCWISCCLHPAAAR